MYGNSLPPQCAQTGVHKQLAHLLDRHRTQPFQKPFADYNRAAFNASMARYQAYQQRGAAPLILDSCCGTGASSQALAERFPDHYIIGVDQSAARLNKHPNKHPNQQPPNLDLIRADLVDYWRLLEAANIRLARHYLLYPNPWPKIGHLARRWHGHAVFPSLLALGGILECRSNWRIYIEEFCFALTYFTQQQANCTAYLPEKSLTPFERKYIDSGHTLYRTVLTL